MINRVQQSSTAAEDELLIQFLDSADHLTGKTGLTPTLQIRKTNGSFASPAGAVTEVGKGWYRIAPNATDNNTVGPLLIEGTASGADPAGSTYEVVPYNPHIVQKVDVDTIKTNPVVNAGTVTFPTGATLASTTNITAATGIDVTKWSGTNVAAVDTAGYPKVTIKSGTGTGELSLSAGLVTLTTSCITAIVAAVWSAAVASYNGVSGSFAALLSAVQGDTSVTRNAVGDISPHITAIQSQTDQMTFDGNGALHVVVDGTVDATFGGRTPKGTIDGSQITLWALDASGNPIAPASGIPSSAAIADAVRDVSNASPAANSLGAAVNAVKAKTDSLPTEPAAVGSAMTLATDAVNAAALATNAVTEITDAVAAKIITDHGSGSYVGLGATTLSEPDAGAPPTEPTADVALAYLYGWHAFGGNDTQDKRQQFNSAGEVIAEATITPTTNGDIVTGVSRGKLGAPS